MTTIIAGRAESIDAYSATVARLLDLGRDLTRAERVLIEQAWERADRADRCADVIRTRKGASHDHA